MQSVYNFTEQYPWVLPTIFAVLLLFGLFIRRRAIAARATRLPDGGHVTTRDWNRARIQFLMTFICVILLIFIWILQTYFPSS
jgi:hypothetical protein